MINITFVITGLNVGGAEMMLLKLLERLPSEYSPHVVSLTDIGPIGLRIQSLGIPVTALRMQPRMPNPLVFLRLLKTLKQTEPDIVQTWMYHADLLGGIAARLLRVPVIVWNIQHSTLSRQGSKFMTRLIARICAKVSSFVPDCILSCSYVGQRVHEEIGYESNKFEVIANGIDIEKFQPDPLFRESVRQELGIPFNTPLVGLIARFDPQKNHLGFFEAAGYLHKTMPDVHFLLAGHQINTGNPVIMDAVYRTGIKDVTHLLNLRDDIPRLMAALDVFVLPSTFGEGFPNVLGEAMAAGVPCVATDVGDSAYIIGDTGRIVAPGDIFDLSEAIYSVLNLSLDDRIRLGQKARCRIQENFEINHVVDLYESQYLRLHVCHLSANV